MPLGSNSNKDKKEFIFLLQIIIYMLIDEYRSIFYIG